MVIREFRAWKAGMAGLFVLCAAGWGQATALNRTAPGKRLALTRRSERKQPLRQNSGSFLPFWSGHSLLEAVDSPSDMPIIWSTDKDGRQERIPFAIPGGHYISVYGLAGGQDGTIAVIGSAYSGDERAGMFLALIAPDQSRQTITRLSPYVPEAVIVTPDGVVWILGYLISNGAATEPNILRRFDSAGKILSTSVVDANGRFGVGRNATSSSLLRSSVDRVGWLTRSLTA